MYQSPLNMYNSTFDMSCMKRFCLTHVWGPMIHMRFSLPKDLKVEQNKSILNPPEILAEYST